MPRTAKPGIDWPSIRAAYEAGESAHAIAKRLGNVTKQAIYKRLKREAWGQVNPGSKRVNQLSPNLMASELSDRRAYSPERAERILDALRQGGTYAVAAAAIGITPDTLKQWREQSPTFSLAVDNALATHALHNVGNIQTASDNGDWKAAERLLGFNPLTKGDVTQVQGTGGITIILNVPRADMIDITPEIEQ